MDVDYRWLYGEQIRHLMRKLDLPREEVVFRIKDACNREREFYKRLAYIRSHPSFVCYPEERKLTWRKQ